MKKRDTFDTTNSNQYLEVFSNIVRKVITGWNKVAPRSGPLGLPQNIMDLVPSPNLFVFIRAVWSPLFGKYLLSSYCVSGSILDIENTAVNKTLKHKSSSIRQSLR